MTAMKSDITPNPTKEEIDALVREVEESRQKRMVRTAVNPEREYVH